MVPAVGLGISEELLARMKDRIRHCGGVSALLMLCLVVTSSRAAPPNMPSGYAMATELMAWAPTIEQIDAALDAAAVTPMQRSETDPIVDLYAVGIENLRQSFIPELTRAINIMTPESHSPSRAERTPEKLEAVGEIFAAAMRRAVPEIRSRTDRLAESLTVVLSETQFTVWRRALFSAQRIAGLDRYGVSGPKLPEQSYDLAAIPDLWTIASWMLTPTEGGASPSPGALTKIDEILALYEVELNDLFCNYTISQLMESNAMQLAAVRGDLDRKSMLINRENRRWLEMFDATRRHTEEIARMLADDGEDDLARLFIGAVDMRLLPMTYGPTRAEAIASRLLSDPLLENEVKQEVSSIEGAFKREQSHLTAVMAAAVIKALRDTNNLRGRLVMDRRAKKLGEVQHLNERYEELIDKVIADFKRALPSDHRQRYADGIEMAESQRGQYHRTRIW